MALPPPDPGSTCLITGASSGIGVDFARQFAERGYGVFLVARREERLRELACEIEREHGVRAEFEACDLADPEQRDPLAGKVGRRGLAVDVLVNNAGYGVVGDFHEKADLQANMVRLNCEAVVALAAAFLPAMVDRGRGAVINVSSVGAFQPFPVQAVYGATKAFVLSFSEGISAELKGTGVTATALCPGPMPTEFVETAGFERSVDEFPSFVWSSADDVARAGIEGARRGKRVVVPGIAPRAAAIVGQHAPRSLMLGVVGRIYRRAIGE